MIMRKIVDGFLKPIFLIARELFPYILIIYLILFLLENLFIGIVSNNFNLNWILGVALGLGLLSVFAPEISEEPVANQPQRSDYILVVVLAIIGGIIIFAKVELAGLVRWMTAGVSAGLIALVGVVLLGKDEEIEDEPVQQSNWDNLQEPVKRIGRPEWVGWIRRMGRRFLTYRVRLPLVYVLAFVILTAIFLPQNVMRLAERLGRPLTQPQPTETVPESPLPSPYFWDDLNNPEALTIDPDILIRILNGGAEKGAAASASAILKTNGYAQVSVGNAEHYDYTNVVMMFRAEDKAQASVIKKLLSTLYTTIIETPAEASASGITVILGAK